MIVELSQHHLLLDVAQQLGAHLGFLRLVGFVRRLDADITDAIVVEGAVRVHELRDVDIEAEIGFQCVRQAFGIPLLLEAAVRDVKGDDVRDHFLTDGGNGVLQIVRVHQLCAVLVDDAPLIVGDVIVFQQILADIEVVRLDLALRALDLPRQKAALDGFALAHAGAR